MHAIQKLYEACKVSLSERGPLFSESIDNVRAVLGKNRLPFWFWHNLWNIQPKGCKIDMNQEKFSAHKTSSMALLLFFSFLLVI